MSKYQNIITDLLNNLKIKNKDILQKVNEEISILEKTEGIGDKNNLEKFYEIYNKKRNKEPGKENKINSWLAYSLGLTIKKPEGEFLPERRAFARAGFPDIDSDFDYFRRDEVVKFLTEYFGEEYTGNVGTYQTLKLKATVRRIGKALDIAQAFHKGKKEFITLNEEKVNEITKSLPTSFGIGIKVKDENGNDKIVKNIEDAYKYCSEFKKYMDLYPDIRKHAKNLEGLTSSPSRHASGFLVCSDKLTFLAPKMVTRKGPATQFAYEDLESLGIIKFDLLGISTITVIKETLKLIKKNYDIDLDIKNLKLDDEKTYELYRSGKLTGVFQCEKSGMQDTIKQIEVNCIDDIAAAISLYRPGPMANIPSYANIKKGLQQPDYFHPAIEAKIKPILKDTYSILIYQESLMEICREMAGMSIDEGYVIIKAIGKKKRYLMDKYKIAFIDGCEKNNIPRNVSEQYWDKYIVPFADYAFNRSHSVAYSLTSYYTCYLKAHYPDEFFTAYMNVENYRKKHDKVSDLENDLENFGIDLLPRNINTCGVDYKIIKKRNSLTDRTQIMPSIMVKGIGEEVARDLEKNAPYESFKDIAYKTQSNLVSQETIGFLFDAGFFNDEHSKYNKKLEKGKKITKDAFKNMLIKKFALLKEDAKNAIKKGIGPESLI